MENVSSCCLLQRYLQADIKNLQQFASLLVSSFDCHLLTLVRNCSDSFGAVRQQLFVFFLQTSSSTSSTKVLACWCILTNLTSDISRLCLPFEVCACRPTSFPSLLSCWSHLFVAYLTLFLLPMAVRALPRLALPACSFLYARAACRDWHCLFFCM